MTENVPRSQKGIGSMMKLFCALAGVKGNAFSVTIDASESVGDLKKAIKKENEDITCAARKVELFLARMGDNTWLDRSGAEAVTLDENGHPEGFAHMDELNWIEDYYGEEFQPKRGEIHVLVVVPEGATSEHDSWALLRETNVRQMRLEMQLEQLVASLPHKSSNSYSDAALGQLELRRLEKDQLIIEVAPIGDGEAFWSEETQIKADAITDEAIFDAFITPYFSDILHSCGMVFVNSERYEWLSQNAVLTKNKDLKPDGFATHRGMFRGKPVPNDGVPRPSGFRFGVAEEELFDCLILFESKLTITETAFGQVARYLQNLLPEAPASAILFDRRSFWLIKSHKSVVVKVQIAKWTNNGSKSLFRNFITDNVSPWVSLLSLACSCLGVDVVEGDAFLGRGAHGRVFKVIRREGEVFALKLVEKCSVGHLYQEKKALTCAQHTGLTTSLVGEVITPEGAALLLSSVGEPLPRPRTQQEVRSLFELLWQLHANNLVHGDPRVPNVILHGGKRLWIDLVEVMEASSTLKRFDAEILTRSTLNVSRTIVLDPALVQLIDKYGERATKENLDRLAQAVWQKLVCQISCKFSN